jgi:hypothetical protein
MTEPFRRLPDPIVGDDGFLKGMSVLTPEAMTTIGGIAIPSSKVIPVIVVPGIMGSNLRATTNKKQAQNEELSAGSPGCDELKRSQPLRNPSNLSAHCKIASTCR